VKLRRYFIRLLPCLVLSSGSLFLCPEARSIPSYEIKGTPTQIRLQSLNNQIAANPKDPKPYIDRAEFWIDYMMLSRARADVERSINIAPTGAAYVWMAKLSIDPTNSGDHKMARMYLEKARSVSSHDLQGLVKTAFTYSELKMFDSAVECLDAALKLQPGDWNLINWKSQNARKAGHIKDALADADYLLSKLPPAQKLESLKKAKENSSQAIHYRIHADAYKTRGLCLVSLHSYAEALPTLNTALELIPDDSPLLKARAEVYRKLGKPDLADADMRKAKKDVDFFFDNAPFSSSK
jgi:tetratricopeptide (TPR) repeat protein